MRRSRGPARKRLTRGYQRLGENLAAVDHLPAPAAALSQGPSSQCGVIVDN